MQTDKKSKQVQFKTKKQSFLISIITKSWEWQKMKYQLCLQNWMRVQLHSLKKNSMKEHSTYFRKPMESWTLLISPIAKEIFTIYLLCSIIWPYATRKCSCSKNVLSALNMLSNTCLYLWLILRKRAYPIEWEKSI